MNAFALGVLLVASAASAQERPRLFLGGSFEAGAGLTHRRDFALSTGGVGLAIDLGSQVTERFAFYLSLRGSSALLANQGLAALMFELSLVGQFSIAAGAGALAIHWPGIEVNDRSYAGLAVPVRASWDFVDLSAPGRKVGLRLSVEAGVSPVGTRPTNGGCGICGFEAPVVWGGLLVGAVWR